MNITTTEKNPRGRDIVARFSIIGFLGMKDV
jgi:hypothetical protein